MNALYNFISVTKCGTVFLKGIYDVRDGPISPQVVCHHLLVNIMEACRGDDVAMPQFIFCDRLRNPIRGLCSFVSGLLLRGSPIAIIRRIIPVILAAINRVAQGRSWTHIARESLKRIEPLSADFYAPAAIVGEVFAFRFKAPLLHRVVNFILLGFREAVRCVSQHRDVAFQASAAPDFTLPEGADRGVMGIAANTFAQASRSAIYTVNGSYCESRKYGAHDVAGFDGLCHVTHNIPSNPDSSRETP